jgi:cell division protein FtsL
LVVAQEKIEWQQPLKQESKGRRPRPTKKGKQFAKWKSILVLAFIVGMTSAIGAETIHLTVVQGAQVRAAEKEISTIKAQNDLLQMEADKLRAMGRIESVAISMGMEKPAGVVYVTGAVPAVKNQKEAPITQVATQTIEAEPTILHQFSQMFTSYFASTQR